MIGRFIGSNPYSNVVPSVVSRHLSRVILGYRIEERFSYDQKIQDFLGNQFSNPGDLRLFSLKKSLKQNASKNESRDRDFFEQYPEKPRTFVLIFDE